MVSVKYTFEDYEELPESKLELIDGVLYMGGEPVRLIIFEKDVQQLSEPGKRLLEGLEQPLAKNSSHNRRKRLLK